MNRNISNIYEGSGGGMSGQNKIKAKNQYLLVSNSKKQGYHNKSQTIQQDDLIGSQSLPYTNLKKDILSLPGSNENSAIY
jgi:hypothetical protein